MLTLGIETSSNICGVALCRDGQITAELYLNQKSVHAEKLIGLISELLQTEGISIHDIGRIGISAGPGSYTGLRIGMATAKGISFSRKIPVVSIGTLDMLVFGLTGTYRHIYSIIPNLKNELYYSQYSITDGRMERHSEYSVGTIGFFIEELEKIPDKEIFITGDLREHLQEQITEKCSKKAIFIHRKGVVYRPAYTALLAESAEVNPDWSTMEPVYLKGYPVA